jgi:hypothetical protein
MTDPLYLLPLLALIALGAAFRYSLQLTQATLRVGVAIAPPEFVAMNKTGLQDAVTPPRSSNIFFAEIALTLGLIVWLWYAFGLPHGVLGALLFFMSGVVAGATYLPKPDSRHFVMLIFASLSRRYANYERDADKPRASAMRQVLDRFVLHYGGVVGSPDKT